MKFLEKSKKITVLLLAMVMVLSNVVPAMAQTVSSSKKTKGEELKTTRVVEDGRSYTCIPLTKEQVKSMEKPIYSLRSVGEDIPDGRYRQIAFEWGVYDSYFPANTKVELFVADIQNKKKIVIGETDVLDKSDFVDEHGKGYNVKKYYMLKQTANYDEWDAKAKADSKNYKYGLRYPENLLYSVTARFTKGVEMTVNQVAMSLYSVDWNTLGNEKLNLKANFYETADEAFPVELNECDNGKKYYTTMQDHDKITYVIKDDGSSEQVEIHGGSKNWIRTSAGLDNELGASRNRFELIDPKTGKEFPTPGYQGSLSNDYGLKEGEFTVPDTGKHYKFKVTGDHRTPFNIAVTQQLNVILNLNDGTMDGAQNGKKTVKVWYGEDSTEPTAPKKQNVMFLGWSDQEGATEVADGGFLPKKFTEDNKNYYAVYSEAPEAVQALSLKLNATVDAAKAKEAIVNNANMPGKTRDQQVKPTTYAWETAPVTTNPDKNGTNYNVILTYPDGTTATVPVLVKVTDDRTDADKYGANLVGKEIRVWKDTPTKNINWRDGVVDPTDEAIEKAFKKATVSEGTDPARKTDTVGTVAGKVKVTWEDTSTTLVDQDLIVLNNVVDEGTKLPKEGGIKVTFKKGTGVATIENGTADITKIVGPSGYELKTADFPSAQADVNYDQNKVIWEDKTRGTLYVVNEDNNEFTAVAEKLSEETVIPYEPASNDNPTDEHDQNIPTKDSTGKNIDPNKYVRVAVKIDPDNAGVLAIKDKVGPVVSALVRKGTTWETVVKKVKTDRGQDGYKFWYWDVDRTAQVQDNDVKIAHFGKLEAKPIVVKIGDTITWKDGVKFVTPINGEIQKKITVVDISNRSSEKEGTFPGKLQIKFPGEDPITVDQEIIVVGDVIPQPGDKKPDIVPDNFVPVTFLDGGNGVLKGTTKFWVNPDKEVTLKAPNVEPNQTYTHKGWKYGDTELGKVDPIKGTFAKETNITATYKPSAPRIEQPTEGDEKIVITFPNGAKAGDKVEVTIGKETKTVDITEDMNKNAKKEVKVDKALEKGTEITAKIIRGNDSSDVAKTTVKPKAPVKKEQSETPKVNPVKAGDTVITGEGVPGATVIVTLPNGDIVDVVVNDNGNWSVSTKPLRPGDVISAIQEEKGKTPSEKVTVIVEDKHDDGYNLIKVGVDLSRLPKAKAEKVEELATDYAYIKGYPDGSVRPDGNITRAEASAMVARLQKLDMTNNAKPDFVDVESGWYNKYLNAVVAKDMLLAEDGKLRPNDAITRAEFARLIAPIDSKNGALKEMPFEDAKGHKFEEAIKKAYANGRIEGYPDGTFKPDGAITRAEATKIINSLYDRMVRAQGLLTIESGSIKEFKDLSISHWGYYEIVEASNTHMYKRAGSDTIEELWIRILDAFID